MSHALSAKIFVAAAIVTSALAGAQSKTAHALDYPVYVYNTYPTTTRTFQGGMVVGSYYTTSAPITLNSLGFIDLMDTIPPIDPQYEYNYYYHYFSPTDTLHANYQVGIWDSSATLKGFTIVTPESTLIGDFRYSPIYDPDTLLPTSVTIPASSNFVIAALLPVDLQDAWLRDTTGSNMPGVVGLGGNRAALGATSLVYPTSLLSGGNTGMYPVANGYTGFVPAVSVPEPASVGLLFAGCAALLLHRRR